MTFSAGMLNSIGSLITDFLTGIFAFIPQMMYFVYTCCACILDFFQYVVRKLAGLDTYYIDGVEQEGDLLLAMVKGIVGLDTSAQGEYSTLSTVFWSLVIFGLIILVVATILKLIMTHYNYNSEKSNPMVIIKGSLKSIMTMALIPIVTIFGIAISNALLSVLDQISAGSASTQIESVYRNSAADYKTVFKTGEDSWGREVYASYDFFGFGSYTNQTSISGQLFKVAANSSNRVRKESFTPHIGGAGDGWANIHNIFTSNTSDEATRREEVAMMIDFAFANNLTLKNRTTASVKLGESLVLISSFSFLQSAVWYLGTIQFNNFSKFNVGLVWYYYNLWGYNYFIAFAGLAIALTLLINIVFGLITRLIQTLALFMIYPAIIGISPLDEGKAQGSWKSEFIGNVLMAYGSIVGMNLSFMILPMLEGISFFNSVVPDLIFNMIIMIAALVSVKRIIAVFSQIIGAKDANAEGESTKDESVKNATAVADKAMKVAVLAVKVAATVYSGGAYAAKEAAAMAAKKIIMEKIKKEAVKKIMKKIAEDKMKQFLKDKAEDAKDAAADKAKDAAAGAAANAGQNKNSTSNSANNGNNNNNNSNTDSNGGGGDDNGGNNNEENNNGGDQSSNSGDQNNNSGNNNGGGGNEEPQEPEDDKEEDDDEDDEKELLGLTDLAARFKQGLGGLKGFKLDDYGVDRDQAKKSIEWFDKQIKALKEQKQGAVTAEDIEELKNKATERFISGSQSLKSYAEGKHQKLVELKKAKKQAARAIRKDKRKARGSKIKEWAENSPLVEITASSLKAAGAITGVSTTLKKTLEDGGVIDSFYQSLGELGKAMGFATDKLPKTKKQKEDEKKARKTTEAQWTEGMDFYSKALNKQLSQMTDLMNQWKGPNSEDKK